MRISKNGLYIIKKYEGFRNHPYLDTANVPTIGYGFTYYSDSTKVKMTDAPMTKCDADVYIEELVVVYEDAVNRNVKRVLNQNQFDAIVSFTYNLGESNLKVSTLLKKINKNPCDPAIEQEFQKWVYSGGKKSKGLKKRRNQEYYLYNS